MRSNCVFCRELGGSRDTNFAARYPEIDSRIIFETDSLVAFPCIGQLAKGHFLVVPKVHDNTFKQTSSRIKTLHYELLQLNMEVHNLLGVQMEDSLYFEHGALSPLDGGCGIYHAHVHVVPNAGIIQPKLVFNFGEMEPLNRLDLALSNVPDDGSYVLVGSEEHGYFYSHIDSPLPSQTLRRNVAHVLGLAEWDWRKSTREENMIATLMDAAQ